VYYLKYLISCFCLSGICLSRFKSYLNKRKRISNTNGVIGQKKIEVIVLCIILYESVFGHMSFKIWLNSPCDMNIDVEIRCVYR